MVNEVFYQIYDAEGKPQGGRIFRSPDPISPLPFDCHACLPAGWTMVEVASAEDIIPAPVEGE
jgi:hypothetical protein